jgi:hypothetical protein
MNATYVLIVTLLFGSIACGSESALEAAVNSVCDRYTECAGEPVACATLGSAPDDCEAAAVTYMDCVAALECTPLLAEISDGPSTQTSCTTQFDAANTICNAAGFGLQGF